jgi:hypothetical protein
MPAIGLRNDSFNFDYFFSNTRMDVSIFELVQSITAHTNVIIDVASIIAGYAEDNLYMNYIVPYLKWTDYPDSAINTLPIDVIREWRYNTHISSCSKGGSYASFVWGIPYSFDGIPSRIIKTEEYECKVWDLCSSQMNARNEIRYVDGTVRYNIDLATLDLSKDPIWAMYRNMEDWWESQ